MYFSWSENYADNVGVGGSSPSITTLFNLLKYLFTKWGYIGFDRYEFGREQAVGIHLK